MMTQPILSITHLRAGYGDLNVLFDINLDFRPGECVLLIGPNGCGKSTLLKVIGQVLKPTRGEVRFHFSGDLQDRGSIRGRGSKNRLGFLKQTHNIFPALTVMENLKMAAFYSRNHEFENYLDILFAIFPDLKDLGQRRAGLLSGGMRQKLAIGMALARQHELLLLDEPTAGLAPHAAAEILSKIKTLTDELTGTQSVTIIMVEHNYKYVRDKIDRLVGMREGKIVIDSSQPVQILENKVEMEKIFFG